MCPRAKLSVPKDETIDEDPRHKGEHDLAESHRRQEERVEHEEAVHVHENERHVEADGRLSGDEDGWTGRH